MENSKSKALDKDLRRSKPDLVGYGPGVNSICTHKDYSRLRNRNFAPRNSAIRTENFNVLFGFASIDHTILSKG